MTDVDIGARFATLLAEAEATPPTKPSRGKPPSPRTRAIRILAKELKVSPDSLRKRLERDPAPAIRVGEPVTFDIWGLPPNDEFVERCKATAESLLEASGLVSRAKAAVTMLLKDPNLPVAELHFTGLLDDLTLVAKKLKDQRPIALCPYCKGLPGLQETCAACVTKGTLRAWDSSGVPPSLKDRVDPKVLIDGEVKRARDLFDLPEPEVQGEVPDYPESVAHLLPKNPMLEPPEETPDFGVEADEAPPEQDFQLSGGDLPPPYGDGVERGGPPWVETPLPPEVPADEDFFL